MAGLDGISIVFEHRPCYVGGRKEMFHQCGQEPVAQFGFSNPFTSTLGIVALI